MPTTKISEMKQMAFANLRDQKRKARKAEKKRARKARKAKKDRLRREKQKENAIHDEKPRKLEDRIQPAESSSNDLRQEDDEMDGFPVEPASFFNVDAEVAKGTTSEQIDADDAYLREKLDRIFSIIATFAKEWSVYWGFADISISLFRDDLFFQELASCLEDYCAQKDLDHFVSSLMCPDIDIPAAFIRMILANAVIQDFLNRPFWYFYPEHNVNCDVRGGNPSDIQLQRLFLDYQRVDIEKAHIWRGMTVSLKNARDPHPFDNHLGNLLDSYVEDSLLKYKAFVQLLRRSPVGDGTIHPDALPALSECMQEIANLCCDILAQKSGIRFGSLHDLPPPFAGGLEAHRFLVDGADAGECRPLLGVLEPVVFRDTGIAGKVVIRKARVWEEEVGRVDGFMD
ncbi:hypothetical protein BJY04DRAFT_215637 [Aspergillus karnatakaensis]|uniref:uncharacterized protein n=1 Tax=Aspergillus karnatakaensis TaxID=1810916 RepID=UPI003CCD52FB